MCVYLVLAALILAAGVGCANRDDAVAATTGKEKPQTQMTPQDLEQLMRKIGPGYQVLQKHLQANETAEAGKQAQQLAELFGGVEKFWTQHNRPDAAKWAGEARTLASDAAGTAAASSVPKATAAAEKLGGVCKQCHSTYREDDGQGGYRIKASALR